MVLWYPGRDSIVKYAVGMFVSYEDYLYGIIRHGVITAWLYPPNAQRYSDKNVPWYNVLSDYSNDVQKYIIQGGTKKNRNVKYR